MDGLEILLWVAVALLLFASVARVRALLRPQPFPVWMAPLLESPLRRIFFSRERTLERSGLLPGQRVLEVGPGSGYLTELAHRMVEPDGRLVCMDLQMAFLRKVRERLGDRAPDLVCAHGEALPFRDEAFDLVFVVSVLGEIPDKRGAMREFARTLHSGGVLAVTEALPDPDYVRTPVLLRLAESAGFRAGERLGHVAQYTHRFVLRTPG